MRGTILIKLSPLKKWKPSSHFQGSFYNPVNWVFRMFFFFGYFHSVLELPLWSRTEALPERLACLNKSRWEEFQPILGSKLQLGPAWKYVQWMATHSHLASTKVAAPNELTNKPQVLARIKRESNLNANTYEDLCISHINWKLQEENIWQSWAPRGPVSKDWFVVIKYFLLTWQDNLNGYYLM